MKISEAMKKLEEIKSMEGDVEIEVVGIEEGEYTFDKVKGIYYFDSVVMFHI